MESNTIMGFPLTSHNPTRQRQRKNTNLADFSPKHTQTQIENLSLIGKKRTQKAEWKVESGNGGEGKEIKSSSREKGQDLWSFARVLRIEEDGHVSITMSRSFLDINLF